MSDEFQGLPWARVEKILRVAVKLAGLIAGDNAVAPTYALVKVAALEDIIDAHPWLVAVLADRSA